MPALVEETFQAFVFGWYKIVFIHRNYKFNKSVQETEKQYAYLSVTFRQHDNYTDFYDGKMANCCQKVRGKKANQRANNNKTKTKQTNNRTKKQTKQQQNRRMGAEGYKANNYSNVIINIDLREIHREGEG